MSKKGNFLIYLSDNNINPVNVNNTVLSEYFNLLVGNYYISLHYSKNAVFAKSNDENIIILLSGNIYQDDLVSDIPIEEYLLKKYLLYKKDFVKYLNGSFCLFFAQKNTGEVYFATDRINSRKLFKFSKGKNLIFSTYIKYLPVDECKLNYTGVASYLINGGIYNDLTLFDEIKKLDRASVHKIVDFKIISNKYWDYYFTNEYENRSEADLADELNHLYVQGLKRLIKGKKKIFLSLSGGYDSRGVAAMLKENTDDDKNIVCISHNFGKNIEETDSDIAQQIAEKLGYPFRILNSYNGNLFNTLKHNAELGQGLAYFCIEWDAWNNINSEFEECDNCILLVGDVIDSTFSKFHGNLKRALERTQVFESGFLKEFRNYVTLDVYKKFTDGWDREYNKLLNMVMDEENLVNSLDYLFIDQRIPHKYSIARECFQMPFIETATPYYDNDVLDFMRKLPSDLRDNKKLHKLSLETKYPDIFKIKFPTRGWGSEPVWIDEIKSFSDIFINYIKNCESKLDDIILPDSIIKSILSLNYTDKSKFIGKSALKSFHNTVQRLIPEYHKIIENLPGGKEFTRKAGRYINPRISHPLIKILILRLFLSKRVQTNDK